MKENPAELLRADGLASMEAEPTITLVADRNLRIGRYELVYELGSGGMASVYLARSQGPGGFAKWFAIKRILPELGRDPRFVDMFLDEAKIAASLQHPNVAQVFELGREKGELFIVMEYLHGEHLGSVAVRAFREAGGIGYELASRIVGWAADGLHHAHEAKGPTGQPIGLVHRDVSPQNVFVTYDGSVKLTDFGIAKATDRTSKTQTGAIKGKAAYMSPEQAWGRSLDRRSDVFALGVVLWEITVGRRLFQADSDVATLLQITSAPVPSPSSIVTGYPPDLERVVLRAIAKEPGDRYPSAGAMARDLDRFVAASGAPVGSTELAALQERLFADRIAAKDQILRGDPGAQAGAPTDINAELAVRSDVFVRPRSRRRVLAWTGASVIAIALGAALLAPAVFPAATAPIWVHSDPSGARVTFDGTRQNGATPLRIEHVAAGRHTVRLDLDGHHSFDTTFETEGTRIDVRYALSVIPTEPARADVHLRAETVATPPTSEPSTENADPTVAPDEPTEEAREARQAYLNLRTTPWATVTANGRSLGETPLLRRAIPSGSVSLRLQAEGTGRVHTLRIRARPGEVISRSIDLR